MPGDASAQKYAYLKNLISNFRHNDRIEQRIQLAIRQQSPAVRQLAHGFLGMQRLAGQRARGVVADFGHRAVASPTEREPS